MVNAISIKGLNKWYNASFHALKDVNLEIEKGDFFGYLGKNGAGKTTTINCITGLSNFQKGSIKVFGKDVVKDYQETRKRIGLAQQDLFFDPALTVEQIIKYQAGYFGMKGKEVEDKTWELLKEFNLDGKASVSFRKLSGGMRRKLQLVKTLVHDPDILVLDEPTSAMDVETRHEVWTKLRKLNKQGTTIVLTSHYIEEIEQLCNKIGIIHEGKIIAFDEKKKLLKALSKQKVFITLEKPLGKMPAVLEKLKVQETEKPHIISFGSLNVQEALPKVLHALNKQKLKIKSIDIAKDKLEDIYLALTGART